MKRARGVFVLLTSVLFLAGNAHAIDLVSYMGLKAGKWKESLKKDYCGNSMNDEGTKITTGEDGSFLWKHYVKNDGSWVYGGHDIWKVTSTRLKFIGSVHSNSSTSSYNPAIAIPRNLALNTPFVYKGSVVNQSTLESKPVFISIMIADDDVAVTTSVQSFTGCIKLLWNEVEGNSVHDQMHFMCPGRGEVKSYRTKAKKSTDPLEPIDTEVIMTDLKAFGNTKPPF